MTRKSVKFSSGRRRGPWKTSVLGGGSGSDGKGVPSRILISASCSERWSNLKTKFKFQLDSELVEYLLTLGEAQPEPSSSPDRDSEDGWCPPCTNGRKKRGPSLRAVLRRSDRKTSARLDLTESIESDEFHCIKSDNSVHSGDETISTIKCDSKSRNIKFKAISEPLVKIQFDSRPDDTKEVLSSDDEKEAKANQLNAELALLVKSVDLKPHKEDEHELYEFRDDTSSDNGLTCRSPSGSVNSLARGKAKRWRSYHKDKRKWKQSYAAIVADDVFVKSKPCEEESSLTKSDKEKKLFKTLKKNRILTAYLDSQNKITDKESSCLGRDCDCTSTEEQDEKLEVWPAQLALEKASAVDTNSIQPIEDREESSNSCLFEKIESSSGKENQGNLTPTEEPIYMEVGERVKLKKRRKKPFQDSEALAMCHEKEGSENLDVYYSDGIRTTIKHKKNWKKSIINSESEDKDLNVENRASPCSSSSISNTHGDTHSSSLLDKLSVENRTKSEVTCKPYVEDHKDSSLAEPPESELCGHDSSLSVAQCSKCFLKHATHTCPVFHPHKIIADSVTFEQWQLQCQVQVRCSVIESPRSKPLRSKKALTDFSEDNEKKIRDIDVSKCGTSTRLYAEQSLPPGLELKVVDEDHGESIFAGYCIEQFSQFGPLVGPFISEKDISDESDMRHIWEVLDGKKSVYINTEDPQKSNWLRFIRPAPEKDQRNLTVAVRDKQLYFVSTTDIQEGDELLFWADDHVTSWSKKKILKSSCGGCNMRFAHPLYYRTHCAVFHDPLHSLTIRKYHCKVCGESVMGKENIMKHAADLHDGRGAYQCQYCHKFFLRLNYLEMHRTYGCSANPHRTRPLCDFCGRYFCQPQKLKVHIKRMHSDMSEVLREFQCKSCLKILGSRAALQRHFKEVHHRDVVVASNCDRCGKSFQNRSNLKIHMLTHSGVKPFRCQQDGCSAAFTTKQCLQFHYKKAHGLSEDALPRIERSIAYTFDAYAGETIDGSNKSDKDKIKKPLKAFRKTRKSSSKSGKNESGDSALDQLSEDTRPQPDNPVTSSIPATSGCSEFNQENQLLETQPFSSNAIPTAKYTGSNGPQSGHHSLTGVILHDEGDIGHGDHSRVLTPLKTVSLQQSDNPQNAAPMMVCHSSSHSPQSPMYLPTTYEDHTLISLEKKGHKKWLGEVIEVAEEAAAAAMRLSPRLSPCLKRDAYDFNENKAKCKGQFSENTLRQDMPVDTGLGRSKTATALAPFHHPESASLLVEAALDAAERDICCPTFPSNLPPSPISRSPENFPVPLSYNVRSPYQGETSNGTYYGADTSMGVAQSSYIVGHEHSPDPHSHHHLTIDSYNLTPPTVGTQRLYDVHNHHMHQSHLLVRGPPSSDEEGAIEADCNSRAECAQNLSLNLRDKMTEGSDSSSVYSLQSRHPEQSIPIQTDSFQNSDAVPPSQQNDLGFSGTVGAPTSRYHMYSLSPDHLSNVSTGLSHTSRSSSQDYTTFEGVTGSVDLSLNRASGHPALSPSPSNFSVGLSHQYGPPHCIPTYPPHPPAYQTPPLQRAHISSSSSSPNASPSPGPVQYHSYPSYY